MHSFGYRANALLTFSLTILAFMCAIASLSDNLNSPSPTATVQILNVNRFQKKSNGDDEVGLTLDISADLQSLFTWNTKQVFVFLAAEYSTPKNSLNQVSLWDGIIPAKEEAKFSIKAKNKYRFIDQNSVLKQLSGYKPSGLKECVQILHDLQLGRRAHNLVGVREKYKQHKFKRVSELVSPSTIQSFFFDDVKE